MLFGYGRVSSGDLTHDLQKSALAADNNGRVVAEVTSGARAMRPGLDAALT